MLFGIGTKVKFKHSGDIGKITEQLDDQMVKVYLIEEDMIIPAFIEDLERYEEKQAGQSSSKAKIVAGKQQKKKELPERIAPQIQYNILKSKGIQLAFDPTLSADGSPLEYDMVLINDTRSEWLYSFALSFRGKLPNRQNGKLPSLSYQSLGVMQFDELNDAPTIDIDCWRITTQGSGAKQHKNLKIKPKSFFSKQLTAPLLNRKVHLYLLFPPGNQTSDSNQNKKEDIKKYTQRRVQPVKEVDLYNPFHEVVAMAEFEPEIDLHIEKIQEPGKKIKPNEILTLQLQHFERYMDDAIRLGVPRVFIIHGLGTGKLRSAIATRLLRMPEVKTFKNEYHARYGYGATEVIFE